MKKLPVGIQSIRDILEEDQLYVDKTGFARDLIKKGKHYFMSRPRRFGKSLFLSTLKEIFKGNKELFKGCQIYESDYSWEEYPVLYFDFAQILNTTPEKLEAGLQESVQDIAKSYRTSISGSSSQSQLKRLIIELSTKNRVVVLVDEYDHPIINNLENLDTAKKNRDIIKGFFTTLKSLDEHLRFTFITGVSKFSQVSLFSGVNNLKDITMNPKYAEMMGYTEGELREHFKEYVAAIAEERQQDEEEIWEEVRTWYNGYRFTERETHVYNPFSTLNFMDERRAKAYWYATGTPSFLLEELKKHTKSMVSLDGTTATEEHLMDISRLDKIDLEALMYQTGYFTIKGYNPISKRYQLGLPNEEVRSAFTTSLVQHFAPITKVRALEKYVKALETYQPDFLFKQLEVGFSSFPYQVFLDAKECTYQGMLLSMLYGMGFDPLSERATSRGRIDVVLEVPNVTYIIELKIDRSVHAALKQIHEMEYFKPYTYKGKNIVIIGANFSSKKRIVSDWKGELLSETGERIQEILPTKKKNNPKRKQTRKH